MGTKKKAKKAKKMSMRKGFGKMGKLARWLCPWVSNMKNLYSQLTRFKNNVIS